MQPRPCSRLEVTHFRQVKTDRLWDIHVLHNSQTSQEFSVLCGLAGKRPNTMVDRVLSQESIRSGTHFSRAVYTELSAYCLLLLILISRHDCIYKKKLNFQLMSMVYTHKYVQMHRTYSTVCVHIQTQAYTPIRSPRLCIHTRTRKRIHTQPIE